MLIIERAGKSELGGSAPRYIVLQWCKLLLPFGLALAHFRQRIYAKPRAIIREFYNLDGARIAFCLVVIGESGKANTFHAHEQAVCPGRRRAKDQSASRDFIHSDKSRTKPILPDSSAGGGRPVGPFLRPAPAPRPTSQKRAA